MVIKDGLAVEVLGRRLSLVEPENDRQRKARNSVNGQCVFLSLKTGTVKFLRLSNVDLCFLAFRSSKKDDLCNKPSLYS